MPEKLDAIDRRILHILQEDGSLSVAQVAEHVGLSHAPCWRRIQRLEKSGAIKKRIAVLDREEVGFDAMVFVLVKLSAQGRAQVAEFADAVQRFAEVQDCHVLLGDVDFILRIVTRDIKAYERFFYNHLSKLPGIQEIRSSMVLTEVKQSYSLPILTEG
ncbi:Lrp/AsnC family transcriptional regulator [Pedomonas mirosovicensis]|uniref:Lrp/AsnC family transcriptional regulator n=1 Tax=Pedomonas mirosovicensis TaxID=2908641 RepID=UPI0021680CB9|nr:Lrp/AsnC family transcriptional regulator [Pedomonas mirosovicensis]MCH8685706.1 Lrp/AsnC family transcriptional regulator [Pedomonas mirosovicensis]